MKSLADILNESLIAQEKCKPIDEWSFDVQFYEVNNKDYHQSYLVGQAIYRLKSQGRETYEEDYYNMSIIIYDETSNDYLELNVSLDEGDHYFERFDGNLNRELSKDFCKAIADHWQDVFAFENKILNYKDLNKFIKSNARTMHF